MIGRILGLILALASAPAFACTDDSGCTAPDRCHFRAGDETNGLCLDSSQMPIERTEAKRLSTPLRDRKLGDTCQFDVDCAARAACFKRPGAAEGKCAEPAQ
jgi:hypothetical protein